MPIKLQIAAAIKAASKPDELTAIYSRNSVIIEHDTDLNRSYRNRMIEVLPTPKDRSMYQTCRTVKSVPTIVSTSYKL